MFFPGLFQKSQKEMTSSELSELIGLSYDTYSGRRVSTQLAMQLTSVFSCIRVLAESVGMLPCSLYEQLERGNKRATKERLHKLLAVKPNNYMTPQELWELLIACLCLRGNFYAYKVYALGEVVELLPLDPSCVTPKLNSQWEPEYQVTFPNGKSETLTQQEIWHVRIFTLDGLVGLSPIAYARQAIGLGLATEEHGSRLFGNGAVTSGVLQTDQYLKDDAYERLKSDFGERHQGLANAHKPMILEIGLSPIAYACKTASTAVAMEDQQREFYANGAKSPKILTTGDKVLNKEQRSQLEENFKEIAGGPVKKRLWILEGGLKAEDIGVSPQDAETMASRKFQVSELARFFGVPPHLVGDVEKSTSWGTGIEQQNLGFLQYTLQPYISRWENCVSRWLLKPSDIGKYHAEHNLDGLLRGDSASRATFMKAMGESGLRTINEMRRLDNYPPLEGGDVAYRQAQYLPINQLSKEPHESGA
ncbi:phage portal protein [Proteus mirabilis]|nr:phage portal protein [Proteus mirabilis]WFC27488.1 phage portal protein [Proteus mirabilis]